VSALDPAPGPDLRLVPAAVLCWATAIAGLALGSGAALAMTLVGLFAALLALARPGPGRGGRWRYPVLAACGCVAAVGALVVVQARQVETHPVRHAAEQGSAATLRLRVTGDPAPVRTGFGGPGQVLVTAEMTGAEVAGARWDTGGRVVLLAPADGWSEVLPGTGLTASGLLAPSTRPDLTVAVLRVRGPPSAATPAPWWQRGADVLRDGLRRAAGAALSERPAGLLPGLAIGDTSTMSSALREEFRDTGLVHLTAVSGANVAIVVGAVFGLLGVLRAGPRTRVACAGLALLGFVVLVRPSPSVLRAAVMGTVGLVAVVAGRRRAAVPALAAAVIGLLLTDPGLGTDPGFALSVLATGALVLLAPGWTAALRERGVPPGLAEALTVPAAAHLVTAPVVAGLTGQMSLVAVVANVLAAPAVAPATVLGVLAAVVSPVSPAVAQLCVWVAGPAVGWLVAVAHQGAGIAGGSIRWPGGAAGGLLTAALVVAGLVLTRWRRFRALLAAVVLGLLLVLVPTRWVTPGWPVRGWAVVACDVGQGDALVVSTGEPGRAVLVDTGTEDGAADGCLDRLGVVALPLVVLSHLHADHVGGLAAVLDGRSVGAVAVGPVHDPTWAYARVRAAAAAAGAPVVELRVGQSLGWPGLRLDVLGPVRPPPAVDGDDGTAVNDVSLVLRAHTAVGRVLLTGDVELLAQAELVASGADLRAEVLKVPHHGSRYSSNAFLAAVAPRLALVSVGAGNSYRQPNAGVLDQLRRAGTLVRRTDEAGDVAVIPGPDGPVAVARGSPRPAPRRG
jgi:competence protein ComEC